MSLNVLLLTGPVVIFLGTGLAGEIWDGVKFNRFDRKAREQRDWARWFVKYEQFDLALSCYELAEWNTKFRDAEYVKMSKVNRQRRVRLALERGDVVRLSSLEAERRKLEETVFA